MEGHARKCVERFCELANKKVEQLNKVSNHCLDDHQFKQDELEAAGELSEVSSQIVLKCLSLERIGRTSLLDQSPNGHKLVTDVWQDKFHTFITQVTTDNIVMWVTQLSIVDWVYSKTQILLVTLKTRNQLQGESWVSSEVEHLSPSLGYVQEAKFCLAQFHRV